MITTLVEGERALIRRVASMPDMEPEKFLALDPNDKDTLLSLKAIQYDIVCNGIELSSGAVRNHRPDVMKKAFAIAGYPEDVLEEASVPLGTGLVDIPAVLRVARETGVRHYYIEDEAVDAARQIPESLRYLENL